MAVFFDEFKIFIEIEALSIAHRYFRVPVTILTNICGVVAAKCAGIDLIVVFARHDTRSFNVWGIRQIRTSGDTPER
jgi:hypothetical protein